MKRWAILGALCMLAACALTACGGAPARPAAPASRAPADPGGLNLAVAMERVRAVVAASPGPTTPIRDQALETWLKALALELNRSVGRGRLPFLPGQPREPISAGNASYNGDELELRDGDRAGPGQRIGFLERAFVLIDGDAHVGFARDSIVIATGRLDVAHVYNSVVIAGGDLNISHVDASSRRPGELPSVVLSGGNLRAGHSTTTIFGAAEGIAGFTHTDQTFVSSPVIDGLEAQVTPCELVLGHRTIAPLEAQLEAVVSRGHRPRACVSQTGQDELVCGREGDLLSGPLAGWSLRFTSPSLVVLARGDERIRLRPTGELPRASTPPAVGVGEVHAIGIYEPQLPGGRVPVRVERTGAPLWLVLMSHDEVSWDVSLAPGVELVGVVLSSWGPSRVAGLPPGTRVIEEISAEGGAQFGVYDRSSRSWSRLRAGLSRILGWARDPISYQGAALPPASLVVR